MKQRGFTIVELILVITILSTLVVLGVVNLKGSLANGRDAERKADIEAIATHLETYYESGDPTNSAIQGEYPSTSLTATNIHQLLLDVVDESITAPGITDPATTFKVATTEGAQTPTFNQYIYQPLQVNGALCTNNTTQECIRFNIYYRLESNVNIIQVKESKNQ